MLTIYNNHGGNSVHGTLGHDMVTVYHEVASSRSRTKQISTKINQCSMEILREEYTCGMGRNNMNPHASFMGSIPHDHNLINN